MGYIEHKFQYVEYSTFVGRKKRKVYMYRDTVDIAPHIPPTALGDFVGKARDKFL